MRAQGRNTMNNEKEVSPNLLPDDGLQDDPVPSPQPTTAAAPAPEPGLADAYQRALAENKDLYDRLLRKQAEMDNFRKRTQKEKEELRHYAAEELIRALLPTLDAFDRALQHRDNNVPATFYQGLELIDRDLREVLGRYGVTPIDTTGQIFDHNLHQAVETVEDPQRRDHEIVSEMQRGYKLKSKLLRPAIVKVAVGGK